MFKINIPEVLDIEAGGVCFVINESFDLLREVFLFVIIDGEKTSINFLADSCF